MSDLGAFILEQIDDAERVAAVVVVLTDGTVRTFASDDNERATDIHAAIIDGANHIAGTGRLS